MSLLPELELDEAAPVKAWLRKEVAKAPRASRPSAQQAEADLAAVLEVVRGKPARPAKTSTSPIWSLWRSDDYPPWDEFIADLTLVAHAFHDCPAGIFSRDVRAEGQPQLTDRQDSVSTLCVQRRWADRLHAARRWDEEGRRGSNVYRLGSRDVDQSAALGSLEQRVREWEQGQRQLESMGLDRIPLEQCGDDEVRAALMRDS